MPRTPTTRRRRAATAGAQPRTATRRRRTRANGGFSFQALRITKEQLLILGIAAGVAAGFASSSVARNWMLGALGYGLIPVGLWLICFLSVVRYRRDWVTRFWRVWVGSALAVAISLGILSMLYTSSGVMESASLGGYWGQYLGGTPLALGAVKLAVLALISPLLLFPQRAPAVYRRFMARVLRMLANYSRRLYDLVSGWSSDVTAWAMSRELGTGKHGLMRRISVSSRKSWRSTFRSPPPAPPATTLADAEYVSPVPAVETEDLPKAESAEKPSPAEVEKPALSPGGWKLPSLDLLSKSESHTIPKAVLQQMGRHIEETLAEHRVDVAVEDIRTGPRVIRFGLVPGWIKKYKETAGPKGKGSDIAPSGEMSRVKVQSILTREKDLALALKTPYLRIEAPVPGEALVGLEVPNPYPRTVGLRSVAESAPFLRLQGKGGLPVALGEGTAGEPKVADLTDLPHLLIAGATGSGKSVCINSIVASLLLTNEPHRLRMLMVDPKRVELTPFNGIPHLIAPVIVDTDEVLAVLRASQNEMLRRYRLMEELKVRNIEGFNKKSDDQMPALVIIIDELADLMMAAAYEVEHALVRLAQLGRATGIHLILATQRPSVNVVTGLLKANIPARIAFAVASQVDSRVILDSAGAEKLLGQGDMLLLSSDSPKPIRVQGTFVHEREIEKLVEFWQIQSGPELPEIPLDDTSEIEGNVDSDEEDELLDRARELAERQHHISASVLQRRLQIGYLKAKRLVELLEDEGVLRETDEVGFGSQRDL